MPDILAIDLALGDPQAALRHLEDSGQPPATPAVQFLSAIARLETGLNHADILEGDRLLLEARDELEPLRNSDPAVAVHFARAALELGDHEPALEVLGSETPGADLLRARVIEVSSHNSDLWRALYDQAPDRELRDELHRVSPRNLVLLGHDTVDSVWACGPDSALAEELLVRVRNLIGLSPEAMTGVSRRIETLERLRADDKARAVQSRRGSLRKSSRATLITREFASDAAEAAREASTLGMEYEAADLYMAAYYSLSTLGPNYDARTIEAATMQRDQAIRARDPLQESMGWQNLYTALGSKGEIEAARLALDRGIRVCDRFGFDSSRAQTLRASQLAAAGMPRPAWALRDSLYREMRSGGRVTPASQLGPMAQHALAAGDSARAIELATHLLQQETSSAAAVASALATICQARGLTDAKWRDRLQREVDAAYSRGDRSRAIWLQIAAGDGYLAIGDVNQARTEYEGAWKTISTEPERRLKWVAEAGLARACHEVGDTESALEHAESAWAAVLSNADEWARDVSRISFLHQATDCADLLIGLYVAGRRPSDAFRVDEESRALSEGTADDRRSMRPAAGELLLKYRPTGQRVFYWVVEEDTEAAGEIEALPEDAIRGWIESRSDPEAFRRHADEWGKLLLGPATGALERHSRVRIIVDGPLRGLPLAFLRHEGRWLIETHEVSRSASARRPRHITSATGGKLWIADGPSNGRYRALQVARREVQTLHDRYGGRLLLGPADGDVVEALREGPAVVHVATHSGLDAYGTGFLELGSGTEPTRVSATELLDWPWGSVRLANLASCSSDRSGSGPHELQSLSGALLTAGVGSVLGSLWDIPDRGSAEFMTEFYAELLGRAEDATTPAQALQQVQRRWLLANEPGPLWWTGLVVLDR